MNKQDYPKEQVEFIQAVFNMRHAQKAFKSQGSKTNEKRMAVSQQKVDKIVEKYMFLVDVKKATSEQSTLFI